MKRLFFILVISILMFLPFDKAIAQAPPSPGTSPDVPSLGANNSPPGTTTTPNPSDLGATVTTTNGNSSCTETAECLQARQRMQSNVAKIKPLSVAIGFNENDKYFKKTIGSVTSEWWSLLTSSLNDHTDALIRNCPDWLKFIIISATISPAAACLANNSKVKSTVDAINFYTNITNSKAFDPASMTDNELKGAAQSIRDKVNDTKGWMPTKEGVDALNELANAVQQLEKDTQYYDQNCANGCFPGATVPSYDTSLPDQHYDNYTDFRNHISSVINIAALSADTHSTDVETFKEPWWQDLMTYLTKIIFKIIEFVIGFVLQIFGSAAQGS